MTRDELWIKAMELGAASGCHQRPDRSFFIGGYQLPVCARCTGVLIGHTAALILSVCGKVPSALASLGMLLTMGADWFIQYVGLRESVNPRRLITGILGGMGVMFLWVRAVSAMIKLTARK